MDINIIIAVILMPIQWSPSFEYRAIDIRQFQTAMKAPKIIRNLLRKKAETVLTWGLSSKCIPVRI